MFAAILATALATPPVAVGALLVFRALTASPDTGRHRITAVAAPYRPRSAAELAAAEVPAARQQKPLSPEVTALLEALAGPIEPASEKTPEQLREEWARRVVAAAGHSWETHMAKFDGTVVARETPLTEQTREVARIS